MPSVPRSAHALLLQASTGCVCAAGPSSDVGSDPDDRPEFRRVAAAGDPTAVQRTVETDDAEYIADEDAVCLVLSLPAADPDASVTETVPFSIWTDSEAALIAAEEAAKTARERLGPAPALGAGIEELDDREGVRPFVSLDYEYDETGELADEPAVDFDAVVEHTPATVDVSVTLDGRTAERSVDVFVQREVVER